MESMKYEQVIIDCTDSDFSSKLDELCTENVHGHIRQLASAINMPPVPTIFQGLQNEILDIATTPEGNADSPAAGMFAQPHIVRHTLSWLLERFDEITKPVMYYFQSQNDNLSGIPSKCGIPRQLHHASRFLGKQQAANLWIGCSGTTLRLHNDNYDNVYVQLSGQKRIYLSPPSSVRNVDETMLQATKYNEKMELIPDEGTPLLLFPTYNPATQPRRGWLFVGDLEPGEVLFLPALWYHQVEIRGLDTNVSVNYWHTSFYDEKRWAEWNFTRQITNSLRI